MIFIFVLITKTIAGPFAALTAYGLCQTGCNTVAVACYAAAGATFGTVTAGAAIPAAVVACNAALGVCMAACAGITIAGAAAPTPNLFFSFFLQLKQFFT